MADTVTAPQHLDDIFPGVSTEDIKKKLVGDFESRPYHNNGVLWLNKIVVFVSNAIAEKKITRDDLVKVDSDKIYFPNDEARTAYTELLKKLEKEKDFSHLAHVSIAEIREGVVKMHRDMYRNVNKFVLDDIIDKFITADYVGLVLKVIASVGAIRAVSKDQTVFAVMDVTVLNSFTETLATLAIRNKELFKQVMFLVDYYHGLNGSIMEHGLLLKTELGSKDERIADLTKNVEELEQLVENSAAGSSTFTWSV